MRRLGLGAALLAMLVTTTGSAAWAGRPRDYPLRGGHCRTGYQRETVVVGHRSEHGKRVRIYEFWCYTSTTTRVQALASLGPAGSTYLAVTASVYAGRIRLLGQPVEFTIYGSERQLGMFTQPAFNTCTLLLSVRSRIETFAGRADAPYPACPLAYVSKPRDEPSSLGAFYVGIGGYAESMGLDGL
jgi:hypothetical protein